MRRSGGAASWLLLALVAGGRAAVVEGEQPGWCHPEVQNARQQPRGCKEAAPVGAFGLVMPNGGPGVARNLLHLAVVVTAVAVAGSLSTSTG